MSLLHWIALLAGACVILIIWQLDRIGTYLKQIAISLISLDTEVFHIAQEQNPKYGLCSSCRRREIVNYVVPKDQNNSPTDEELFYCKACWWMSGLVDLSDEKIYYKDRQSEQDKMAATIGPGPL